MLPELDRNGKTTPELFEHLNLRLAHSVTARNALGITEKENAREIATLLYGEIHPGGNFRFANFGHPPPLVFSAEYGRLVEVDEARMVQFLALGLQLPANHPDRKKYYSMSLRKREFKTADVAEIKLMSPGDMLVLYTDGVYDGVDQEARQQIEAILREHYQQPARDICNALLDYSVKQDDHLRESGDEALIDDKTLVIVKRTE
jgi:serine phosphatase RsbU (regulator of sigma subunit)